MLSRLRKQVQTSSSTQKSAAVLIAAVRGVWGAMRGRRGSGQHLRSTLSFATGADTVSGRPMNITIEPTNACNLECPVCETGAGILGRETGHMSLEDFRTIIDKVGAHTNTLMFYFMGEPFLNKHAYEMIRYAKAAGIPFVETCTNGDFVDPRQLVDSGLDKVSFQIGGTTQETHEVYRVRGQLDRVFRNLEETLRLRRERRSRLRVEVGFILMKHNEHEVADFRQAVLALGADEAVVIDPCVRTVEQGHQFLPVNRAHWFYDEEAFSRGVLRPKALPDNICPWIYYSIAVHVNGNVVPCCRDPRGLEVMGNLIHEPLEAIWNGPRFQAFRERLRRNQGDIEICRLCSSYPASKIH
jgi:radical SAM protein with 4Fe4S-binding SPASM domain